MTSPSPHPTEQLSSLLTREETPGSFQQDWIPYEMCDSQEHVIAAASRRFKESQCHVPPVKPDESASDTYLRSHTQGLEDCLTRLDQKIESLQGMMNPMALQILAIEQKINLLIEAMAEDDEDEPRTYMDGTPI